MKKEEWEKVEKALSGTYGQAKLQVDDREVTFQRALVSKNRLGIGMYIDGELKGKWLFNECPEQLYFRPAWKSAWPAAARREMKKLSKRSLKQLGYDPDKKHHYFTFVWPNVTAIRRHYQKTFESIELIEVVG